MLAASAVPAAPAVPLPRLRRPGRAPSVASRPLLPLLRDAAADPTLLRRLEPHPTERRWTRLHADDEVELWLISWPPGTETGWHDHGSARGAFRTLRGRLTEDSWHGEVHRRRLAAGDAWAFPTGHLHDVRNDDEEPALSLHVYAPRLEVMRRYELVDGVPRRTAVEPAGERW